jgi:hypothetical protein
MHEGLDWLRPVLAGFLLAAGVFIRLVPGATRFQIPFGLPWADVDEDIRRRSRHRLGESLIAWALWILTQMAVGLPPSWIAAVWAPLSLVVLIAISYPARLYLWRYFPDLMTANAPAGERVIPKRGGWLVILLREILPLATVLIPILVVRAARAGLPERIPVGWTWRDGPWVWMDRDPALDLLRHQTMVVYLVLLGLEGSFVVWRGLRGKRGDLARRMLTPRHWFFFLFRLGWVGLFAGLNVGFVFHALKGGSPLPYLLPGLSALALLGFLLRAQSRRPRASGPAKI